MAFVRKNALVVNASFLADDGTATQPATVTCYLAYTSLLGAAVTTSFALAYNAITNSWFGVWDSNVAGKGTVSWVVYGAGVLQAAAEGCFEILANTANTV